MDNSHIIIRPIISEKSMREAEAGKFTFEVVKTASKTDIKQAIEKRFEVHISKVFTTIVKGKKKRYGQKRIEFAEPAWKKAVVAVKKGEKIALFDVREQK